MKRLTERQKQVLGIIIESIEQQGYPPTLREIGERLGIRSTNGVSDHIKALTRKGYLLERKGKSFRTLLPSPKAAEAFGRAVPTAGSALPQEPDLPTRALQLDMVEVPIIGRVAAGEPLLAEQRVVDRVHIDRTLLPDNREVFSLRVQGESMIGDGIFDGDFVFVRRQALAPVGAIVVALIEGEATVKRFYPERDRVRFQPSNPTMEPIYVHRDDFRDTQLLGVVVGVYRRM